MAAKDHSSSHVMKIRLTSYVRKTNNTKTLAPTFISEISYNNCHQLTSFRNTLFQIFSIHSRPVMTRITNTLSRCTT
ncbi:hypothetical protein APX70_200579 [Pseudomonas syringae pv. maculicola]|uniref:Uncharacterized protein n=1 Tax=Pseudomonas syringae pv. maculicola TaxID=59511 RepID=A0A3M2WF50_PSEYM|nr:hypothetical protein APX70_200579 [Pseudomonas syringae pv. maculicola]